MDPQYIYNQIRRTIAYVFSEVREDQFNPEFFDAVKDNDLVVFDCNLRAREFDVRCQVLGVNPVIRVCDPDRFRREYDGFIGNYKNIHFDHLWEVKFFEIKMRDAQYELERVKSSAGINLGSLHKHLGAQMGKAWMTSQEIKKGYVTFPRKTSKQKAGK